MEFRPVSKELENALGRQYRKDHGIFFTPRSIRRFFVDGDDFDGLDVLEPSFGSGEFIRDILEKDPSSRVVGVEYSKDVFDAALSAGLKPSSRVELYNADFLTMQFCRKFDRIIGNPPYKPVQHDKEHYRAQYPHLLCGKFDIYILFLLKCLALLKQGGQLKLVLPTSFINVASYNNVRRHIVDNFTITSVEIFSPGKWLHTSQRSMGVVIRNERGSNDCHSVSFGDLCLIHDAASITSIRPYQSFRTLKGAGFVVKTGEVVWNSVEEDMTDDPTHPLLVHNSNLKDGHLIFSGKRTSGRKPRIRNHNHLALKENVILVNRGHGNNGNLPFHVALVDPTTFADMLVVENHVYKILDNGKDELGNLFDWLCGSQMRRFIEACSGGGGLTKAFLEALPFNA